MQCMRNTMHRHVPKDETLKETIDGNTCFEFLGARVVDDTLAMKRR